MVAIRCILRLADYHWEFIQVERFGSGNHPFRLRGTSCGHLLFIELAVMAII